MADKSRSKGMRQRCSKNHTFIFQLLPEVLLSFYDCKIRVRTSVSCIVLGTEQWLSIATAVHNEIYGFQQMIHFLEII